MEMSNKLKKIVPPELRDDIVESLEYLEGIRLSTDLRSEYHILCSLYGVGRLDLRRKNERPK